MPTENRSSNIEMVSVPKLLAADTDRDMLEYLAESLETQTYVCDQCGHEEPLTTFDIASDLRDYMLAFPQAPTQHQGEPAASPWREGEPPHPWNSEWFLARMKQGHIVVLRPLPEEYAHDYATADETYVKRDSIVQWAQLSLSSYVAPQDTHAAPGEVERLRKDAVTQKAIADEAWAEVEKCRNNSKTITQQVDALRAQLADLREMIESQLSMLRLTGPSNAASQVATMLFRHDTKFAALSSSAEPSAPVIHPINMKTMMKAYEQVDHEALLYGTSNWCASMATALRGAIYSEPSAPVPLCSTCKGYGKYQDGDSGTDEDGRCPNIVECECDESERMPQYRASAPVERDERAEFESALRSIASIPGDSINYHATNMSRIARAALERKP